MHKFRMVFVFRAAHIIRVGSMILMDFNGFIAGTFRIDAGFLGIASITGFYPFAMLAMGMPKNRIRVTVNKFMEAERFHASTTKGVQIHTG